MAPPRLELPDAEMTSPMMSARGVKPKHQLLPFPIGSWAGHPFWQITQDQQKRMFKANTQTKVSKKGGESEGW